VPIVRPPDLLTSHPTRRHAETTQARPLRGMLLDGYMSVLE